MADNVHVYSVIIRGLTEVQLASGFDFTHTGFLILFLHCHMNFLISSIHLFFFLADYQYFVLHSMFFFPHFMCLLLTAMVDSVRMVYNPELGYMLTQYCEQCGAMEGLNIRNGVL